jgi:hypothetical protein
MFGEFCEFLTDKDFFKNKIKTTFYKEYVRKITHIIENLQEIKNEFKKTCGETFQKLLRIKNESKIPQDLKEKKRLYKNFDWNLKKLDEEAKNFEKIYLISAPKKISEINKKLKEENSGEDNYFWGDFCNSQSSILSQVKLKFSEYDENTIKNFLENNKILEDLHFKKPNFENILEKKPIMITFYLDNSKFSQRNNISPNNIQINTFLQKKLFIEDSLQNFKQYFKYFCSKVDRKGYNYFQFGGELLENFNYNTFYNKFMENACTQEKLSSGNMKIYRFLEDIIIDTDFNYPSNLDSNLKLSMTTNICVMMDVREQAKILENNYK